MFELLLPLFGTLLLLMFVLPPLPLFTTLLLRKQGATCQSTAKTTQHTHSVIATGSYTSAELREDHSVQLLNIRGRAENVPTQRASIE